MILYSYETISKLQIENYLIESNLFWNDILHKCAISNDFLSMKKIDNFLFERAKFFKPLTINGNLNVER